jgi:hypothetical protein
MRQARELRAGSDVLAVFLRPRHSVGEMVSQAGSAPPPTKWSLREAIYTYNACKITLSEALK